MEYIKSSSVVEESKEKQSQIGTRSKGKDTEVELVEENSKKAYKVRVGSNIKIRINYGAHINEIGVVKGLARGYIILEIMKENELKEVYKRRDHVVIIEGQCNELDLEPITNSDKLLKTKSNSRRIKTKNKRKGGRQTKIKTIVSNPIVTKLLRKKVAVLKSNLVGKVVYYDSKKDTYTIRLNENNLHNIKQMENSSKQLDISCKLKLKANEIMLWEEYKINNGIIEEKDKNNKYKLKETLKKNKNLLKENDKNKKPINLLGQLQKSIKFRKNAQSNAL